MLRSVVDFCLDFHTSFCQCCLLLQPDHVEDAVQGHHESGDADCNVDYEEDSKKVARQESLESTNRTVARALFNVAHLFDYSNRRHDNLQMTGLKSGRGGEYANGNGVSLLLLGPAQSGKSTFFRQLQLMHGKCFTTLQEKITFRPIINENLLGSLHTLVTKMPMFQIALSHKGSEKDLDDFRRYMERYRRSYQFHRLLKVQDLENNCNKKLEVLEETCPQSLGKTISNLWNDPGVQQVYGLAHQFQLNETANYFLDNAERICNTNYIPTVKDILHARLKTTGASELKFEVKQHKFLVIDVGGQRCQRTQWLSYFNEVDGVIFIASLSGYNLILEEDPTENQMIECIKLFYTLTNSAFFAKTPFILFLNKTDVFKEKLEKYPLRICFERYTGPNRYEPAIGYVEERFRAHFFRSRVYAKKSREFDDAPYLYKVKPNQVKIQPELSPETDAALKKENEEEVYSRLYVHHTCATDTEQMNFVFSASADIILDNLLRQLGLT